MRVIIKDRDDGVFGSSHGSKIWLVGENNPYGSDPRYALFPYPEHSAGGRLCRLILKLQSTEYFARFERRNLLQAPKWSVPAARHAAKGLLREAAGAPMVLLGSKVSAAFSPNQRVWEVTTLGDSRVLSIPHPSGLCRLWNEPGAFERARRMIAELMT